MLDTIFPAGSPLSFRLARVAALLIIGLFLLAWLIGAVLWWQGMFTDLDTILSAAYFDAWAVSDIRVAASDLGIAPIVFPILWFILESFLTVGFGVMSLLLFTRKPDWFGTYLAVVFMIVATSISGPVISRVGLPFIGASYSELVGFFTVMLFASMLYVFPDGRFTPHWLKWVVPILYVLAAAVAVYAVTNEIYGLTDLPVGEVAPMLLVLIGWAARSTATFSAPARLNDSRLNGWCSLLELLRR